MNNKSIILLILGVFAVFSSTFCSGGQIDFKWLSLDEGEQVPLIVENSYYQATIYPKQGGRIGSLILKKSGHDFIGRLKDKGNRYFGWGISAVGEINSKYPSEMMSCEYNWELIEKTQKIVKVKCSSRGMVTGYSKDIVVEKIFTFYADTPVIKVEFALVNHGTFRKCGYRIRNSVIVGGEKDYNNLYFVPTAEGIKILPHNLRKSHGWRRAASEYMVRNIIDGWCGVIDKKSKRALLFSNDYNALQFTYFWITYGFCNVEWFYREVPLKTGERWSTVSYIIPLDNLPFTPSYVRPDCIVGITVNKNNKIEVKILGLTKKKIVIAGTILDQNYKIVKRLSPQPIFLKTGNTVKKILSAGTSDLGKCGLRLEIRDQDGSSLSVFTIPLVEGSKFPIKVPEKKKPVITSEKKRERVLNKEIYKVEPKKFKLLLPTPSVSHTDDSTILLLHLDEGNGWIAMDSSGYDNDGVFYGADTDFLGNYLLDEAPWVKGKTGTAIDFSKYRGPRDSSLIITYSPSLDLPAFTNQIKIEMWCYPHDEGKGKERLLISRGGLKVLITKDDALKFTLPFSDGTVGTIKGGKVEPEKWHHLAMTFDGEIMKIFVDKVCVKSQHFSGKKISRSEKYIRIGGVASLSILDEIYIFDKVKKE